MQKTWSIGGFGRLVWIVLALNACRDLSPTQEATSSVPPATIHPTVQATELATPAEPVVDPAGRVARGPSLAVGLNLRDGSIQFPGNGIERLIYASVLLSVVGRCSKEPGAV